MPASRIPFVRPRRAASRASALAGVVVGLALYVAAFLLNSPMESCTFRLSMLENGATQLTHWDYRTEWAGLVASRCDATLVDGPQSGLEHSERVIEWGPSAIAAVGLTIAGIGLRLLVTPRARRTR